MKATDRTFVLENEWAQFVLSDTGNRWAWTDKRAGVTWGNRGAHDHWVAVGREAAEPLAVSDMEEMDGALRCRFADRNGRDVPFAVVFRLCGDPPLAPAQRKTSMLCKVCPLQAASAPKTSCSPDFPPVLNPGWSHARDRPAEPCLNTGL